MKRIVKYFLLLLLFASTMLVVLKNNNVKVYAISQVPDYEVPAYYDELIEKTYSPNLTLEDCIGYCWCEVSLGDGKGYSKKFSPTYKLKVGTYYAIKDDTNGMQIGGQKTEKYYKIVISKALPKVPGSISIDYKDNLSLKDLRLPSGWQWDNPYTSLEKAGVSYHKAKFVGNKNYMSVTEQIGVIVNQGERPSIMLEDVNYDPNKTLSSISLPCGWSWCNPNEVPIPSKSYYYASYNTNLAGESDKYKSSSSIKVYMTTHKAMPIKPNPISTTYKDKLILKNIPLPDNWSWYYPHAEVMMGTCSYLACYKGSSNYYSDTAYVTVTVDKGFKAAPALPSITYTPFTTLNDISLPRGWYWVNPNVVPTCDKEFYYANYDSISAYESDKFYNENNVKIYLKTFKAKPIIYAWPTASTITYGQSLFDSQLTKGYANVSGTFTWSSPFLKPKRWNNGYMVTFTPQDSTNYETISSKIKLDVLKGVYGKANTPTINFYSDTVVELKSQKGCEYSIDNGVTWQDSNVFNNLNEQTTYAFIVRYKEDNNAFAGMKSDSIEVKTKTHGPSAPSQPEFISKTNKKVILKQEENQEYSCNNGKTWQDSSAFTRLSSNKDYEFVTRIKETQEVAAGEVSQPIVVKTISSVTYYSNIVKSFFSKIKFGFCKVFHIKLSTNVVDNNFKV